MNKRRRFKAKRARQLRRWLQQFRSILYVNSGSAPYYRLRALLHEHDALPPQY